MHLRFLFPLRSIKGSCALAAALFTLAGSSFGQSVLAGWDFNSLAGGTNNFGANNYAATYVDSHVTVGGLNRGSGLTTSGSGAARGWGATGWDVASPTAAAAVAANDFLTFTVAVQTGYTLSLSSLSTFEYRRSGTGPASGQLQYSLNGAAYQNIGSVLSYTATSSSGGSLAAIDFSGASALQNIAAGTTVSFRLADYGATNAGGTFYLFDVGTDAYNAATKTGLDFAISGTTTAVSAIPEPSTYAAIFGGLALVGVMIQRRRRVAAAC